MICDVLYEHRHTIGRPYSFPLVYFSLDKNRVPTVAMSGFHILPFIHSFVLIQSPRPNVEMSVYLAKTFQICCILPMKCTLNCVRVFVLNQLYMATVTILAQADNNAMIPYRCSLVLVSNSCIL